MSQPAVFSQPGVGRDAVPVEVVGPTLVTGCRRHSMTSPVLFQRCIATALLLCAGPVAAQTGVDRQVVIVSPTADDPRID